MSKKNQIDQAAVEELKDAAVCALSWIRNEDWQRDALGNRENEDEMSADAVSGALEAALARMEGGWEDAREPSEYLSLLDAASYAITALTGGRPTKRDCAQIAAVLRSAIEREAK